MERNRRPVNKQTELTRQPNPATFIAGDIFMADESRVDGQQSSAPQDREALRTPEDTVGYLQRIGPRRPLSSTGEGSEEDIKRKDTFPRLTKRNDGKFYIETLITEEEAERLLQSVSQNVDAGVALNSDQEEVLNLLQSIELPEASKRSYLASIKRMSRFSGDEGEKEKNRLLNSIRNAPQRLERAAQKKAQQSGEAAVSSSSEALGADGLPPEPPQEPPSGLPDGGNKEPVLVEITDSSIEKLSDQLSQKMALSMEGFINAAFQDSEAAGEFARKMNQGSQTELTPDQAMEIARLNRARMSKEGEKIGVPESLEDLAKLIIKNSEPKWGLKGEKSLLKTIVDEEGNEKVVVDTINFLDWMRSNMLKAHYLNPTSPLNFFTDQAMGVTNDVYGSIISFYEIAFNDKYFLEKVVDENGHTSTKDHPEYKKLKDQMVNEVFLFMLMRNGDIEYVAGRGEKDKMIGKVAEIYMSNPLTRADFFEFIFSQPALSKQALLDGDPAYKDKEMEARLESEFSLGEGIRRGLAAYMSIYNYDQLVQIFGKNSPIFNRGLAAKNSSGTDLDTNKPQQDILTDPSPKSPKDRLSWFYSAKEIEAYKESHNNQEPPYKDGDIKLGRVNRLTRKWQVSEDGTGVPSPEFMDYINIFGSGATVDQERITEVRERIVQSIMDKTGITYQEAQLAELWAYSMTHFTGVAARNDTASVSHDYWTRLTNVRDKRRREKAEKRGAGYGIAQNMDGFKRIGLTFFEGARDRYGRSIESLILGGTGGKIDIDNNPIKNWVSEFEYERDDKGNVVFEVAKDNKGNEIERPKFKKDANGNLIAKKDHAKIKKQLRFNADIMKQFVPNHLINSVKVYNFISEKIELGLPEIVTGYDNRGNPILDHKKLSELQDGIMHDIKYVFSTWAEINYAEEQMAWERIEVRDEKGRLIAKNRKGEKQIGTDKKGKAIYEDAYLDEDYYVLDKNGNRTQERDEPQTVLNSRVMTRLESMFGPRAAKYIQFEIEKRGLTADQKPGLERKVVPITDYNMGKLETTNIDLTNADSEEFKVAVWKGAFDFLVAAEIEAHRDWNSNITRWGNSMVQRAEDALVYGKVLTPDESGYIRKTTKTSSTRLLASDSGFAVAAGGSSGILKGLGQFFSSVFSSK